MVRLIWLDIVDRTDRFARTSALNSRNSSLAFPISRSSSRILPILIVLKKGRNRKKRPAIPSAPVPGESEGEAGKPAAWKNPTRKYAETTHENNGSSHTGILRSDPSAMNLSIIAWTSRRNRRKSDVWGNFVGVRITP
jgi:hypothetical protein